MSELITKAKKSPSSRVPKYVRIAEAVKADIASGVLQPNDQLPSFTSMTQQFGVTIHTIDKAHSMLEQEGLVRREPGRGVFVEPRRSSRTGNIGLLLRRTDEFDYHTRAFLMGIQEQARKYGLNVMLIDEDDTAIASKTDGALLYCRSIDVQHVALPPTMPRVLILEPATNVEIANVVADDFNGARMATRHLLELGHRRISYMLSWASDPYAIHRLAGYSVALQERGIPFDENLVRYTAQSKGEPSIEHYVMDTEATMTNWLAEGWRSLDSTAILAPNDTGLFGIAKALENAGLKVPQDVSLVGFDGLHSPHLAALQPTTVEVPLRTIGATSVDLLWEQIQEGKREAKQVVVPVQLRIGTTTARV